MINFRGRDMKRIVIQFKVQIPWGLQLIQSAHYLVHVEDHWVISLMGHKTRKFKQVSKV